MADRLLARTQVSRGLRFVLGRFAGYLVFFFGVAIALQTLGIRATTLTAFGAAVGVGVGLGLQDIVKNFVAGLVLLIERPFRVGDRIEMDGMTAEVVEIRARATILRTNDDIYHRRSQREAHRERDRQPQLRRSACRYGPCRSASATPPTRGKSSRRFSRPRGAATRCSQTLRRRCASRDSGSPPWTSSFSTGRKRWPHRPGALSSELHFLIHDSLTRRGIELPYPQRDIHIRTVPDWQGMESAVPRRGGQAEPRRA